MAAIIQVLSFLIISFPLGIYLAFYCNMDIAGFWIGYFVRSLITAIIFWYILWKHLDWEEIAKGIIKREEELMAQRTSVQEKKGYGTIEDNSFTDLWYLKKVSIYNLN